MVKWPLSSFVANWVTALFGKCWKQVYDSQLNLSLLSPKEFIFIPIYRIKQFKMDVNQINIEVAVFLKQLRIFSEQNNTQIDEKTAEMLLDIVVNIDKLIANAEMVRTISSDNVNFVFDLNEQHFDLRHYIMCRLCSVCIELCFLSLCYFLQCWNKRFWFYRNKLEFLKMILKDMYNEMFRHIHNNRLNVPRINLHVQYTLQMLR